LVGSRVSRGPLTRASCNEASVRLQHLNCPQDSGRIPHAAALPGCATSRQLRYSPIFVGSRVPAIPLTRASHREASVRLQHLDRAQTPGAYPIQWRYRAALRPVLQGPQYRQGGWHWVLETGDWVLHAGPVHR